MRSPSLVPALVCAALTTWPLAAQAPAPATPAPAPLLRQAQAQPADPALQRAVDLAKAGKFKEAITDLEAQKKIAPLAPRGASLLGTLYLQVGRAADAFAVLKPLADAKDAEAAILYNTGRAALMLKEPKVAQPYFERSAQLDPASPASRELGLLLAHQGRVVEAYSRLRPWSVAYPTDGEALLTAASLALELERPDEAAQMITGMPQDDPAILLMRAKISLQKGDGAQAVTLLTPLLAKHPEGMETEIRRGMAEGELLAGHPQKTVELLTGHVKDRPTVALVLAKGQHRAGNAAAAIATLQPFMAQIPNDAKSVGDPRVPAAMATEYGRLLAETGHVPEGIESLQRATRLDPLHQDNWLALAEVLNKAGRKDEALQAQARATALNRPSPGGP
jgi:tetratricopeptide (TPR) repeat protein